LFSEYDKCRWSNLQLPPVNETQNPNFQPPPGWYAVSVNYVRGFGWLQPKHGFSYFHNYKPVATAGYSIYIYHIPRTTEIDAVPPQKK